MGPSPAQGSGALSNQAMLESRGTFTWLPLNRLIGFNRNDLPSLTGLWDSVYKVCHILWIPPWKSWHPLLPRPLSCFYRPGQSSQAANALEAKGDHEACNYCL